MKDTSELADALGRKDMAHALGVGLTAISNRLSDDKLPAGWFDALEALAKQKGKECPRHLFAWRRAETSSDAA